jgi:hypothetical protein
MEAKNVRLVIKLEKDFEIMIAKIYKRIFDLYLLNVA